MRGAILLACLSLAACAAPAPRVDEAEMARANQQADVESLKSQMQQVRSRLDDFGNRLGAPGSGATVEDLNERVTRLEQSMNKVLAALSMNPAQSGQPAQPQAPAGDQGEQPAQPAPGGQGESGETLDIPTARQAQQQAEQQDPAEAIYNLGMEAFNAGNYDRAVSLFEDMVKTYPTDRRVPSALLWQAEAYARQGDPARTALICQDLIQKYPSSPVVPQAMLKQAQSFKALGRNQAARIVLEDLVKRYPGSAEARIAQQQIPGLR